MDLEEAFEIYGFYRCSAKWGNGERRKELFQVQFSRALWKVTVQRASASSYVGGWVVQNTRLISNLGTDEYSSNNTENRYGITVQHMASFIMSYYVLYYVLFYFASSALPLLCCPRGGLPVDTRERSYIGYTEALRFKQVRKVQMSITMSILPGRACKMA